MVIITGDFREPDCLVGLDFEDILRVKADVFCLKEARLNLSGEYL